MASRRPANKGKKCVRRKRVKSVFGGTVLRCAKFGAKRKGVARRVKGKRRCKFGVNKITGRCLKNKRRR